MIKDTVNEHLFAVVGGRLEGFALIVEFKGAGGPKIVEDHIGVCRIIRKGEAYIEGVGSGCDLNLHLRCRAAFVKHHTVIVGVCRLVVVTEIRFTVLRG